jgi:hyaluronan synthase/N-acetylglucosaminyltransferase
MGKRCTFGDDRHLTNLVLEAGYRVTFDNRAVAYTHVPEHLRQYVKQQLRWNKSFYREMLWTAKSFHKHHTYLLYDLFMQLLLPFLLLIALSATVLRGIHHPQIILFYCGTLIGIALIRAIYGIYRTLDFGFLLFVFYGFMHVFVLLPTRLYALFTMTRTGWGTR